MEPQELNRYSSSLPQELTDAELQTKADELARKWTEHEDLEDAKRASASEFGAQLKELRGVARRLAREVRERSVQVDVEVVERFDVVEGLVEVVRTDTGEVMRTRQPTGPERQLVLLPFRPEAAEPPARCGFCDFSGPHEEVDRHIAQQHARAESEARPAVHVCDLCKREVADLVAHIAEQHPDQLEGSSA